MSLHRLSLLLIAACCLVLGPGSPRPVLGHRGPSSVGETKVVGVAALATTGVRSPGISPFAAWRYRLKSVLEETDSRTSDESDLGPAPSTESSDSPAELTPRSQPPTSIIPLRC